MSAFLFRVRDVVTVADGRSGTVSQIDRNANAILVQLGPDGPFETHDADTLRFATKAKAYETCSGGTVF